MGEPHPIASRVARGQTHSAEGQGTTCSQVARVPTSSSAAKGRTRSTGTAVAIPVDKDRRPPGISHADHSHYTLTYKSKADPEAAEWYSASSYCLWRLYQEAAR